MCRSCIIYPKLNCFGCETSRSCYKYLKRITQIELCSAEINKLKRQPPEKGCYELPHYLEEKIVEEEREQTQVSYGKCNKCFAEMNHSKSIKNRKIYRGCYNQNRRK